MATDTDLPAQQAHTASLSPGNASPGVDDWTQSQRSTEIVKTVTTTVTTTVPASTIEQYPEVAPATGAHCSEEGSFLSQLAQEEMKEMAYDTRAPYIVL